MPGHPHKPCKQIGCIGLAQYPQKYCANHLHLEKEEAADRHKSYARRRTDSKEQSFYQSPAWRSARSFVLSRDKYMCQHCKEAGKLMAADMVHHKVEVKEDWGRRFEFNNLVSLCNSCHNKAHGKGI